MNHIFKDVFLDQGLEGNNEEKTREGNLYSKYFISYKHMYKLESQRNLNPMFSKTQGLGKVFKIKTEV